MKTLRDKIADIIDRETNARLLQDEIDILNGHEVAQSIIAALPDMVPPLVWDENPDEIKYSVTANAFGLTYEASIDSAGDAYWQFWRDVSRPIVVVTGGLSEAKAAANAHHAAAVVAAITGETT